MRKKVLIPLLFTVALASCATPMGTVNSSTKPMATPVLVNGYRLTPVGANTWKTGRFTGLPRIRSAADLQATDQAIAAYARTMRFAQKRGDRQTALLARMLGQKLVAYRAYVAASSLDVMNKFSASKDGSVLVNPGVYAVLPSAVGADKPIAARVSALRMFGEGVMVADALDVALSGALSVLQQINAGMQAGLGQPVQAQTLAASVPVGTTFEVLVDGQKLIIERTTDSFIVHNPGNAPVKLELSAIGFVPALAPPSETRVKAVPILRNIQNLDARTLNAVTSHSYTVPPNQFRVEGDKTYDLDRDGNATTDRAQVAQGRAAYDALPEYKLAIKLLDYSMETGPLRQQFDADCKKVKDARWMTMVYTGNAAEYLELTCLNKGRGTIRHKIFHVTDTGMVQTLGSATSDAEAREAILKMLALRSLVEGLAGFVPVYGNVDAAGKCLSGGDGSITNAVGKLIAGGLEGLSLTLPPELDFRLADYVSLVGGTPVNASAVSVGVDCANAIPLAQYVAKAGSLAGFGDAAAVQALVDLGKLFDANLSASKSWDEAVSVFKTYLPGNEAGLALLKIGYDALQNSNGLASLASGIDAWKAAYGGA